MTDITKLMSETKHSFDSLVDIMQILRSDDGCPWDKEQTHESIRSNFIEETYEVIEAIDTADSALLREELGDVLLQVVFHARMEEEQGVFDVSDVIHDICEKLITRHPHIFGAVIAETSDEVLKNWDQIKAEEKKRNTVVSSMASIPPSLPALMRADKIGSKAAKVNFDFDNVMDAFDKVYEETVEVKAELEREEVNADALTEEIGDLLFAVANVARISGVNSEEALSFACGKFVSRFAKMETEISRRGLKINDLSLKEMDLIWNLIKKQHNLEKN